MGLRLLTTWHALHPDAAARHGSRSLAQAARLGPALPIAFAAACASAPASTRRAAVEAFAYTRLAATVSAAMRLMPIGQTDAHALLARTLERVPAVVDRDRGSATAAPRIVRAGDGHRGDDAAVSAFAVVSIVTKMRDGANG